MRPAGHRVSPRSRPYSAQIAEYERMGVMRGSSSLGHRMPHYVRTQRRYVTDSKFWYVKTAQEYMRKIDKDRSPSASGFTDISNTYSELRLCSASHEFSGYSPRHPVADAGLSSAIQGNTEPAPWRISPPAGPAPSPLATAGADAFS